MFEDIGPELEANDDRQQRQSGAGGCRNPGEVVVGVRRQLAEAAVESRERSEEHTSELQSLMRISYAVFCLKKKNRVQDRKSTRMNTTQKVRARTHTKPKK